MAQASNAPGMTSATRRDAARRKRIRVLQLRAAGESFDAIAQQVGYQSRGNAHAPMSRPWARSPSTESMRRSCW